MKMFHIIWNIVHLFEDKGILTNLGSGFKYRIHNKKLEVCSFISDRWEESNMPFNSFITADWHGPLDSAKVKDSLKYTESSDRRVIGDHSDLKKLFSELWKEEVKIILESLEAQIKDSRGSLDRLWDHFNSLQSQHHKLENRIKEWSELKSTLENILVKRSSDE